MTTYYADSSALVKRYVNETGSPWVQTLCNPPTGHVLALAHIGLVEIAAALSMKVRQGILATSVRDNLLRDLQSDAQNQYWLIDVDHNLIQRAIQLTGQHKLRGYDAVHLAAAIFLHETLAQAQLPAPVFLCADGDLLLAAQAAGLLTEDPNTHP